MADVHGASRVLSKSYQDAQPLAKRTYVQLSFRSDARAAKFRIHSYGRGGNYPWEAALFIRYVAAVSAARRGRKGGENSSARHEMQAR
jgi:hypothetical protein